MMLFRVSQPKRVIIFWYADKNVDLLLPKEGKKYHQAVVDATTGPVTPMRVGGPSTSAKTAASAK